MLANSNTPIKQNNINRLALINELADISYPQGQLYSKPYKQAQSSIIQQKNNSLINNDLAFLVLQKRE